MAKKKKQPIYDPEYWRKYGNIGETISQSNLQNLHEQRQSELTYIPDDLNSYDYPEYTSTEHDEDSGFLDGLSQFVAEAVVGTGYRLSHLDDLFQLFLEKQKTGERDKYAGNAATTQDKINNVNFIQSYLTDLYPQYDQLSRELIAARASNDPARIQQAQYKLDFFKQSHPDFDQKTNEVRNLMKTDKDLQRVFYDTYPESMSTYEHLKTWNNAVSSDINKTLYNLVEESKVNPQDTSYHSGFKQGAKLAWDAISAIPNMIGKAAYALFKPVFYRAANTGMSAHDEDIRTAIAENRLSPEEEYKMRKYDLTNSVSRQKLYYELNNLKQDYQRELDDNEANYRKKQKELKEGTWLFKPQSIDPEFREMQQNNWSENADDRFNLIDKIVMTSPEMGTSYSDLKAFVGSLSAQWGADLLARGLGKLISPSGKAGLVSAIGQGLIRLGGGIAGLNFTIQGRESETAQEAINAIVGRAMNTMQDRGINFNVLRDDLKHKLTSEHGIDANSMTDDELLQAAMIFNVRTLNPNVDKILKDGHKGLSGLIQRNNALGAADFLQQIPFAPRIGSALSKYAIGTSKILPPNRLSGTFSREAEQVYSNLAEQTLAKTAGYNAARGWIDNRIDGLVKKTFKDLGNRVAVRNLITNTANRAKAVGGVALSEGLEEGQQQYIQYNYENGTYDNEMSSRFSPLIDVRALIDDGRLAFDAALSYFGLNFGDPLNGDDELRQAMTSGAVTGMFFPMAGATIYNIFSKNAPERSARRQFQNDKFLLRYIGENYNKEQRDLQTDALFMSYNKGANLNQTKQALDMVLRLGDEGVATKEDIDEAKKLADYVYRIQDRITSKNDNTLADLGISLNSDEHRDFVKLATQSAFEYEDVLSKNKELTNQIDGALSEMLRIVNSPEELDKHPEIKSHLNAVESKYNDIVQKIIKSNTKRRELLQQKLDEVSKKQQEELKKENADTYKLNKYTKQAEIYNKALENIKNPDSFDKVRDAIIKTMFLQAQQRQLGRLSQQVFNRRSLIKKLHNRFGGLNEVGLFGIHKYVSDSTTRLNKQLDSLLDSIGGVFYSQEVPEKDNKSKSKRRSLARQFLADNNVFQNDNALNDAISILGMNAAITQLYNTRQQAMYNGSVSPKNASQLVRKINWGDLTEAQQNTFEGGKEEFDKRQKQYQDELNDLKGQEEKLDKQLAEDLEATDTNSKVQDQVIQEYIKNKADILTKSARVVQRYQMDIRKMKTAAEQNVYDQERPLSQDDIDNAEDGNTKAQQKVDKAVNDAIDEEEGTTKPTQRSTPKPKKNKSLSKDIDQLEKEMGLTDPTAKPSSEENTSDVFKQAGISKEDTSEQILAKLTGGREFSEEEASTQLEEGEQNSELAPKEESSELTPQQPTVEDETGVEQTSTQNSATPQTAPETPVSDPEEIPTSDTNDAGETLQPEDSYSYEDDSDTTEELNDVDNELSVDADNSENLENTSVGELDSSIDEQIDQEYTQIQNIEFDDVQAEVDGYLAQGSISDPVYNGAAYNSGELPLSFNYQPDADEPVKFKVKGVDLSFGKDVRMGTGSELAVKLATPGWFEKVVNNNYFYYIVSNNKTFDVNNTQEGRDSLTVAMIIKDPDDSSVVYNVTLPHIFHKYRDSDGNTDTSNDNMLIYELMMRGVNKDFYRDQRINIICSTLSGYGLNINPDDILSGRSYLNTDRIVKYLSKLTGPNGKARGFEWARNEYNRIVATAEAQARQLSKINPNTKLVTQKQARDYVDRLRKLRDEIIYAYASVSADGKQIIVPQQVRTDVQPQKVTSSNGRFNGIRSEGRSVYRPISGEDAGFGLSSDIHEMSEQLEDGKVSMGVGKGVIGFFSRDPYTIVPITGGTNIVGKGLAGKLYIVVPEESKPGVNARAGGNQTVLMLHEQKFRNEDEEIPTTSNIEELIRNTDEHFAKNGKLQDGQQADITEVILRLMCYVNGMQDAISTSYGLSQSAAEELLNLIVNQGSWTSMPTGSTARMDRLDLTRLRQPYLQDKQLLVSEKYFIIGSAEDFIPNSLKNEFTEIGVFYDINMHQYRIPKNLLFSKERPVDSAKVRKFVMQMMKRNLHWNTNIHDYEGNAAMTSRFSNRPGFLISYLKTLFYDQTGKRKVDSNGKVIDEVSLFGNSDLTFRHSDFFNADGSVNSPMVLAWLIKTGKVNTNAGTNKNDMFKAPFVYPSGVKQATPSTKIVEQEKKQTAPKKPAKTQNTTQQGVSRISKDWHPTKKEMNDAGLHTILTPEEAERAKAQYDQKESNKKNGRVLKDIVGIEIDLNRTTDDKVGDAKEQIRQKVKAYIKNVLHKSEDECKVVSNLIDTNNNWENFLQFGVIIVHTEVKGKPVLSLNFYNGRQQGLVSGVFGVYSTERGEGVIDIEKSKDWLRNTLGLNEDQMIIVNAIHRAASDNVAYGLTDISANAITNEIQGTIFLSRESGLGNEYHEGFHYVNLLLHNRFTRQKIYDAWRKSHKDRAHWRDADIEEELAEDFKAYMLKYDRNKRSPRLIRFFRNILTFVQTFLTHKREIRRLYNDIRNGRYKSAQIDPLSANEFKREYPEGKPFEIPGVSQKQTEKFKSIQDYQTYYAVAKSLTNSIISKMQIQDIQSVRNVNAATFNEVFDDIQTLIDSGMSDNEDILQDILDNKEAFKKTVDDIFRSFNLKAVKSKKKLDQHNQDGKDSGDVADNVWDIDHLEVSKKTNVSLQAKLFFSSIYDYQVTLDDDGNKVYTVKTDDLIGAPLFVPFSQVWNKIMDDLWKCDSFDRWNEQTNDYDEHSIIYNVRRLSNTDKFYYSLWVKMQQLIDPANNDANTPQIKTHIFNTLVGFKNQMNTLEINNKRVSRNQDEEVEMSLDAEEFNTRSKVRDADKLWSIKNSESLRSKKRLPKKWSQNLLQSSGIIEGGSHISQTWVSDLGDLFTKFSISIKQAGVDSQHLQQAKDDAINILNYMGIPFDELALNNYINLCRYDNDVINKPYNEAVVKILKDMILSKTDSGMIYFRELITQMFNLGKLSTKNKSIDTLYMGQTGKKGDKNVMNRLAQAYSVTHPAASEFSVTGPNGSMLYPFNQNNTMSDVTRRLEYNTNGILDDLSTASQTRHSLLVQTAIENLTFNASEEDKFHLQTFIGIKDNTATAGNDYFEITPLEDYISKLVLTLDKQLIEPTMADKKTYYSLKSATLARKIPTEILYRFQNVERVDENGNTILDSVSVDPQLSQACLNIFNGYFKDEIDSLRDYYSEDNIRWLLQNPKQRIINFHGEIKKYEDSTEQYYDFGGNGGMFRYFYKSDPRFILYAINEINNNLNYKISDKDISKLTNLNMNQFLEFLWEIEHEENISNVELLGQPKTDGFSLIRSVLNTYDQYLTENNYESMNQLTNLILIEMIDSEIDALVKSDDIGIIGEDTNGRLINKFIPNKYITEFVQNVTSTNSQLKTMQTQLDSAIYSIIANHVIRQAISIQEFEKVYTGDPAFYRWLYYKRSELPQKQVDNTKFEYVTSDNRSVSIEVSVLKSKDIDKTKRLGGALSPGTNLKTEWSADDIRKNPALKDCVSPYYTFMNVQDIKAKSLYINDMERLFKKQLIVDELEHTGTLTPEEVEKIYKNDDYAEEVFNTFDKDVRERINKSAKDQTAPYDDITVADAEVILRPAMYRRLRIAVGEWTFKPDATGYSDEIAYNIIEKDASWMSDPKKYAIVRKLQLKPLKMSFFSNNTIMKAGNNKLVIPVYDKMAMFPMFKYACGSTVGQQLYERMNKPGNEIDMIGFNSAVKVGCNAGIYSPYEDGTTQLGTIDDAINNDSNNSIDYETGEIHPKSNEGLDVRIQSMNDLRLQLNTDAHEDTERKIGSQMAKICFSNVHFDYKYGESQRTGEQIINDIMNCINGLTVKGRQRIFRRMFRKDSTGRYNVPNESEIRNFLLSVCRSNGLSSIYEDLLANGMTIASLSSRQLFEQSVASLIKGEIVDINTNGGAAVQQSVFGFVGSNQTVATDIGQFPALNGGKELKWYKENGTMEVFLSMNFFRAIVPEEYKTDYTTMRKWLMDNNIIGPNAKPFGVGYRIPTQGMSSTFGFIVADVLPEISGDLIIVPREFTAQTGSDFDVDKLYLATYSYHYDKSQKKVVRDSVNDDINESDLDSYVKQSSGALKNRLLDDYIDIITDIKNTSVARASIDTLTSKLKKEIVPLLDTPLMQYPISGYELLPSFQSKRKKEYSTGKKNLALFALNVTHHSLTQATHLKTNFNEYEKFFGLKSIDCINGIDLQRVTDWLSAMVNAHVDVAKDPYILILNVNEVTATMVNYLLRSGMGISTFTYIAQPILKIYASRIISSKGSYGVDRDPNKIQAITANKIMSDLKLMYAKWFLSEAKKYLESENLSKEEQGKILNLAQIFSHLASNKAGERDKGVRQLDKLILGGEFEEANVFDVERAKKNLHYIEGDPKSTVYHILHQYIVAHSYSKFDNGNRILSKLVTQSRIDTNKFGNNIISQLNFLNGYYNFIYDPANSNKFYMQNSDDTDATYSMRHFFHDTFLDKKLKYATKMLKMILSNQTFTATTFYSNVFNSVMADLFGSNTWERIVEHDGYVQQDYWTGYKPVMDEKIVKAIGNAIDVIMRHRAMIYYNSTHPVDDQAAFDLNISDNAIERKAKIRSLFITDPVNKTRSVPLRIANIKTYLSSYYAQFSDVDIFQKLCNLDGSIANKFLDYLNPIVNQEGEIDRIVLSSSQMDVDAQFKDELYPAYDELLNMSTTSDNPKMQELAERIRELAKDIILYSYYSSYNNNGVNTFFDLTPLRYRFRYDNALRNVLKQYWTQNEYEYMASILSVYNGNLQNQLNDLYNVHEITKMIARNFWYDDNIVPRYNVRRFVNNIVTVDLSGKQVLNRQGAESLNSEQLLLGTQAAPYVVSVPSSYSNDAQFIKMYNPSTKNYYLYERIGDVRAYGGLNGIGPIIKNVYQIIPKLGIKTDKVTYHELFGSSESESIFDQNSTPENSTLTTSQISQLVNVDVSRFAELVQSKLKQHSAYKQFVGKDGLKYDSLRYYPLEHEGMSQKDDAHLQDDEQFADDIQTFETEEQAMEAAISDSDFVVNIGNNDVEALNSYKTDNYTSKDIDAIVEQINGILQSSEAPTDNMLDNINILITVGPDILNQKMSKDTIRQAIEIESNRLRNMYIYNSDITVEASVDLERKLRQTKEIFNSVKEGTELYDWFNKKANMIRFGAFIDALYGRLTGLSEMINVNVVGENSASEVLILQAKRSGMNYTLYDTVKSTTDNSSVADDMNVPEDMINGYLEDLSNIGNSIKKKVQKEESTIEKQVEQTIQEVKDKDKPSTNMFDDSVTVNDMMNNNEKDEQDNVKKYCKGE